MEECLLYFSSLKEERIKDKNLSMMRTYTLGDQIASNQKLKRTYTLGDQLALKLLFVPIWVGATMEGMCTNNIDFLIFSKNEVRFSPSPS